MGSFDLLDCTRAVRSIPKDDLKDERNRVIAPAVSNACCWNAEVREHEREWVGQLTLGAAVLRDVGSGALASESIRLRSLKDS